MKDYPPKLEHSDLYSVLEHVLNEGQDSFREAVEDDVVKPLDEAKDGDWWEENREVYLFSEDSDEQESLALELAQRGTGHAVCGAARLWAKHFPNSL